VRKRKRKADVLRRLGGISRDLLVSNGWES
jgi:hypothetical protein